LKELGFENVNIVDEQSTPDGNFPTVVYPNPEEEEAMSIALKKAEELNADIVMATDPDADRVGIALKNSRGEFQLLNGNQTGVIIIYYLLSMWKNRGFKGDEYIIKTIVTTELIKEIANEFQVNCYDTLTGFKHIAKLIGVLEGEETFIGGGEESYGYMIGDKVRDKDAVASCVILAEMTAWAKDQGKSLFDILIEIYQQYGLYQETLRYITRKGMKGAEEINEMMRQFRTNPPQKLSNSEIITIIDYQSGIKKDLQTDTSETLTLPKSNVLQYITQDGTKVSVRPSGTEPKIKFYVSVKSDNSWTNYYDELEKLKKKSHKLLTELGL
jgi:phosphoglucomutase